MQSKDSRFKPGFPDLFINTVTATIDGAVLPSHDGFYGRLILDVSTKSRHLGDYNGNLKKAVIRF